MDKDIRVKKMKVFKSGKFSLEMAVVTAGWMGYACWVKGLILEQRMTDPLEKKSFHSKTY